MFIRGCKQSSDETELFLYFSENTGVCTENFSKFSHRSSVTATVTATVTTKAAQEKTGHEFSRFPFCPFSSALWDSTITKLKGGLWLPLSLALLEQHSGRPQGLKVV